MELHDTVMSLAAQLGCEFDDVCMLLVYCMVIFCVGLGFSVSVLCDIGSALYEKLFKKLLRFLRVKLQREETRCHSCALKETCGAFESGVLYPCWWYEKEKS